MAKPPQLDLDRLRRDVRLSQAVARMGPAGTSAAVRAAWPTIKTLRAEGATWQSIADALAAQGVTQGVGDQVRPITRSRLTAIVCELEAQDRRKADKLMARRSRADLVPSLADETEVEAVSSEQKRTGPRPATNVGHRKLQLAAELDVKPPDATQPDQTDAPGEADLRLADFDNVRKLFRDGT